jgi:hypothetical protein
MSLLLPALERWRTTRFLTLVLLSVLLPSGIAEGATPLFLVGPSVTLPQIDQVLPSATAPTFLPGDFNGDGLPDSVALLASDGSDVAAAGILVLLNSKGNAPTPIVTPLSTCNYATMATADLNKDGKLDLVLYCGANYVQSLLGNGDGTFQTPILAQTPTYPRIFALADFNGDGLPDLAYLTSTGFCIALNQGGGHFGNSQSYPLAGAGNFASIATGDFNGDGKQDLIFAMGAGPAAYLLGNGDGTFGAAENVSGTVQQIAVGDFNRDGYSDLAYFTPDLNSINGQPGIVVNGPPGIVVLLGGSGGLAATGVEIAATGSAPSFLTATSLTGSGNLDLVLGNNNGAITLAQPSNTVIFLGDGKGGFNGPMSYAAKSVYGVVDLNGDGFPDLAGVAIPGANVLPYAAGNGDGTFQAPPNTPNGQASQAITVADMNGDGLADAILFDLTGRPQVFLGRGDGRFTPVPNSSLPEAPGFIIAADFNGDGKIDVVSILPGTVYPEDGPTTTSGAVAVYLGDGDGTLTFKQQTSLNVQVISLAAAGDFNGDKKQDLVLVYNPLGSGYGNVALFLPGNGDGTFATAKAIPLVSTTGGSSFQAIDLNGDGITDLILFGASYLGNADGTFTPLQILPVDGWVEDLNGDGKVELVNFANGFLNVYNGNADGTFSANPTTSSAAAGDTSYSIAVGDLNGDGLPDIAAGIMSSAFNVYLNQGGGSFVEDPTTYFAGAGTSTAIALARLNSSSAAAGAQRTFDALAYTSGGLTSLLNQNNAAPKPLPTVSVSFAGGVSSITTGSTVTVNVVLAVTGTTPPTGTVTYFAGSTQIGTSPVTDGAASVSAPITGSGTVVIRAVYSGDGTYGSSTGFASLTVNAPVATTTTLTSSATSVNEQQQVTLTAKVTGNSPTGTVTFLNGTTSLGTAPISGGSASLTTSFANAGPVSVTASYGGDQNNLDSTSATVTITVVAPSFAVAVSPASATITPGQSATFTMTVTPVGGFASAVTFSCGAMPSQSSCLFASPSVTPGNGQPAQVKLTISTAASSAELRQNIHGLPRRDPWVPAGAMMSLAGLLGFIRNRGARRRYQCWLRAMTLLTITCGVGTSLIGCGGNGGNQAPTNPGTPVGTSNITITASAAASASTQTATIQLIVQ